MSTSAIWHILNVYIVNHPTHTQKYLLNIVQSNVYCIYPFPIDLASSCFTFFGDKPIGEVYHSNYNLILDTLINIIL